jgi:hypothetical protein
MTVLGQFVGGMLKQKPEIPKFVETRLPEEQQKALAANLAAMGPSEELAARVNAFSQEQLTKALRAAIPGYDKIISNVAGSIESQTRGELPMDVQRAIERSSAARALGGGFAGSGASRALTARDLGLTSYQITQQGIDSASRWLASARANALAPQMDVTSMFITPQQQYAVTSEQRAAQFQRQLMQNQLNAQYDWRTQLGGAIQLSDQQITQAALSTAANYFGGGMLGGMGGGGAAPPVQNWYSLNPSQQRQYQQMLGVARSYQGPTE